MALFVDCSDPICSISLSVKKRGHMAVMPIAQTSI